MRGELALVALFALSSCDGERASSEAQGPTWTGSIAALVQRHCADCHRAGGAAPFPLLEHAEVAGRAEQVLTVVESGFMPPWLPSDPSGTFHGERGLSSEERALFTRWIAAGAPHGPGEAPEIREQSDNLRSPDFVSIAEGAVEVPREGLATMHTLAFDLDGEEGRALKMLRLSADVPGALHGALFLVDPSCMGRRYDESAPGPGYPSGGNMGTGLAGSFGGWVPGLEVAELPTGFARRLPARADLLVQLHLYPRGRSEAVRASVSGWLAQEPIEHWVTTVAMGALGFELAPGDADVRITDELELPTDVQLVSLMPLARYACTQVHVQAVLPDGSRRALLTIEDYDANWVHPYQYRAPIPLPRGTRIELELVYDNSAANPRNPHDPPRAIRAGMAAGDELAFLLLDLAPERTEDLGLLEQAHRDGFTERLEQLRAARLR